MHHLIYLSSATELLDEGQLRSLFFQCRRDNARAGITGLLLYRDGSFLQLIEGERADVAALFKKICRDSRHHGILKVVDEPITEREFPTWSMSFSRHSAVSLGRGFDDLLERPAAECPLSNYPSKISAFMRPFLKRIGTDAPPEPPRPTRLARRPPKISRSKTVRPVGDLIAQKA